MRAIATIAAAAPVLAEDWAIAVTDVEGLERLQTEWGAFKTALEAASGKTVAFFPVSSRTAAAEALRAERVNVVISGPAEHIVIDALTQATPLIGLGRPDDVCAAIVRADSDLSEMSQLKGETVAFGDVGSTSNMLRPMRLMADDAVDPTSDVTRLHTSRAIAHEALKRGDVAAIGANDTSSIRTRDADDSVPNGLFRVLARSGGLPNDMIMVGGHVPDEAVAKVRDAVPESKQAVIAAILTHKENETRRGMDLVAIEDAADNRVRSMSTTAGDPQFDTFIGE